MSEAPVRRIRRTARIVLLDPDDRVLLFRYDTEGFAPFWIMPGGECDPEEDFSEAARRELLEETGICAEPIPLRLVKEAEYEYLGVPVKSVEHYFHHRTAITRIDTSGHTELERRVMQEHRWFVRSELPGWAETIYPLDIADIVERVRNNEKGLAF